MTPHVSVVTSGHDVADARIHRLCAALLDAGLRVEVIGLGHAGAAPPGVSVRTVARPSAVGRALLAVRQALRARGRVIVALDPDSLIAGFAVARVTRRRIVADVHEDYAALLRDRSWAAGWRGGIARLLVGVATAVAVRADLVVLADNHVPPGPGPSRLVLRNIPYLGLLPAPSVRDSDRFRALYIGDVRASRGLWTMLEAIEAAPGWSLDIVGPVAGDDAPRLEEYLRSGAARERVRVHGRQPPREAWSLATGASCGLALLDDTPAFRAAMPSKLYEYVACGLAVVVTDLPRQRAFVEAWQAGAAIPTGLQAAQRTAAILREWREQPAALDVVRDGSARFRCEATSWAAEYGAVSEAIARLAGVPGRPTPTAA